MERVEITSEELDRIRRRQEIRAKFRNEFNRLNYNPYRYTYAQYLFDPASMRYNAAVSTRVERFVPMWSTFTKWFLTIFLVPQVMRIVLIRKNRRRVNDRENGIRTMEDCGPKFL